jgi:hypothetical protein
MIKSICFIVSIVVLFFHIPFAQSQTFGNWFSDTKSRDCLYAATVNDSGNLLGQFCYPGADACIWMLGMQTGCTKGNVYPVLVNSDSGSYTLEIVCDGQLEGGLYRYAFTNFDLVDDLVNKADRIAFAVPLQQDNFRVIRFDLDGATKAIAFMRAAGEARAKPARSGTRDQTL